MQMIIIRILLGLFCSVNNYFLCYLMRILTSLPKLFEWDSKVKGLEGQMR